MGRGAEQRELAPKRMEKLRGILRQSRIVRVEDLTKKLKVSTATVRRDLDRLENLGEIRRVHGGAVGIESRLEEPLFDDKASIAPRQKHRIATAALGFLKPGLTVYLDGGSTVLELARLARDRTNLTVVTNSLRAALELAGRGPRLILIGGELRRLSQTLVGPLTRFTLEELNVDIAFMGTMGLSLSEGLTTTEPAEAYTKQLIMHRAGKVVLLADSSKAGKVSFARAGLLEKVDIFITDRMLDREFSEKLRRMRIEVLEV
jgi:DeoR family transcriptional regulator, fructose operon transcriptional repressor